MSRPVDNLMPKEIGDAEVVFSTDVVELNYADFSELLNKSVNYLRGEFLVTGEYLAFDLPGMHRSSTQSSARRRRAQL